MLLSRVKQPAVSRTAKARNVQKNARIQVSLEGSIWKRLIRTPGSRTDWVDEVSQAWTPNQSSQSGRKRSNVATTQRPKTMRKAASGSGETGWKKNWLK